MTFFIDFGKIQPGRQLCEGVEKPVDLETFLLLAGHWPLPPCRPAF